MLIIGPLLLTLTVATPMKEQFMYVSAMHGEESLVRMFYAMYMEQGHNAAIQNLETHQIYHSSLGHKRICNVCIMP